MNCFGSPIFSADIRSTLHRIATGKAELTRAPEGTARETNGSGLPVEGMSSGLPSAAGRAAAQAGYLDIG